MALTADIPLLRVGEPKDPISAPLPSGVTVYSGSFALLSNTGVLKNASAPASTDTVIGMIGEPSGASLPKTGAGIVGSGTNQATWNWIDCETGCFLIQQGGTAGDSLAEANAGVTVFVVDENHVGLTSATNTRPAAGTLLPIDPTVPAGFFPIKLAGVAGVGP